MGKFVLFIIWISVGITFFLIYLKSGAWAEGLEKAEPSERPILIKAIEIRGNAKIETSTIRGKLLLKEGSTFSVAAIQAEIRNLFKLGYFDDVRIDTEAFEGGLKLIVKVTEKPILKEVFYIGNEKIKSDTLKEKVPVKKDALIDLAQIKGYQEKLVQYYKGEGYYNIDIVPVLEKTDARQINLSFYIKEGSKTEIQTIRFEGNKVFSESKLKSTIELKEYFWLTSWITDRGVYKSEEAQNDAERIKELYLNNGYLMVQSGPPEITLTPDKKWFHLKYLITEGPRFSIRKVTASGSTLLSQEEILKKVKTREGEIFRRDVLREDISSLTEYYGEKGFAFFNATPQFVTDNENKTVDIHLEISEGKKTYIRRIEISGNDKTRDKVIRRELRLDEQDVFNTRALKRSYERVRNLGFFENLEISPERVSEGLMDLHVKVKEKSTGQISLGGGYSSVDHLIGMFEISQGNFLGKGELLKARAQLGGRSTIYDLTFKEPYVNDYPVSGTINLYHLEQNYISYFERKVGATGGLGKSFGEYLSGSLNYTFQFIDFFNVSPASTERILEVSRLGQTTSSSIGVGLAYDTRDFFFDPKSGGRNSVSLSYGGPQLGGNEQYYKVVADVSRYVNLFWDTVFSVHGEAGTVRDMSGFATLFEGFIVGGMNTVRGFDFGRAGPQGQDGSIIPAATSLVLNTELVFPLVPEAKIKGVIFFDAGRGFDQTDTVSLDGLRYGAGFGLRWVIPQIGPIRFEWGFNLFPLPSESPSRFDFSIGSVF